MGTTEGGAERLGTQGRPLRVVVIGSSVGMYVRPPRTDPRQGTYADLLEPMLHQHGIEAVVVNRSRWLLTVAEAHRRTQELILDHRPDVVVLDFGFVESQPRLAPLWFVRWLFTWRPRLSRTARTARRVLLGPLWWLYVHLSPVLIRAMPWLPSRVQPATLARGVRAITAIVRKERAALTLALDVPEVTERVERTLATMNRRVAATNGALHALAAPEEGLVVVPAASIVRGAGTGALPDGIHYSAHGHRLIAERLVEEIVRWREALDDHVRPPSSPAARRSSG